VNIFRDENEEVKLDIFRHSLEMQLERIEYIAKYKRAGTSSA